jgi:hypothetical protein
MTNVIALERAGWEQAPGAQDPGPTIIFCSHCGARPQSDGESRVCPSCGMGLLLVAGAETAPPDGGAFLVIDSSMSICAVSAAAEQLLATRETDAVNSHLTQLIVPADAEAQGAANLAVAVTWAVRGDQRARKVFVRPTNTFGVRITARIATCGPPQAALVVFD